MYETDLKMAEAKVETAKMMCEDARTHYETSTRLISEAEEELARARVALAGTEARLKSLGGKSAESLVRAIEDIKGLIKRLEASRTVHVSVRDAAIARAGDAAGAMLESAQSEITRARRHLDGVNREATDRLVSGHDENLVSPTRWGGALPAHIHAQMLPREFKGCFPESSRY